MCMLADLGCLCWCGVWGLGFGVQYVGGVLQVAYVSEVEISIYLHSP